MADRLSERAMQSGWVRFFKDNFHSKRQNESHLPLLNLAIHFGQCESSRQKLAAKVVKTKLN